MGGRYSTCLVQEVPDHRYRSRDECFREVSAGVSVAIGVILKKDCSSSEEGSVGHDGKGAGDIGDGEHRCRGKGMAKGVKNLLLKWGQSPWLIILS